MYIHYEFDETVAIGLPSLLLFAFFVSKSVGVLRPVNRAVISGRCFFVNFVLFLFEF